MTAAERISQCVIMACRPAGLYTVPATCRDHPQSHQSLCAAMHVSSNHTAASWLSQPCNSFGPYVQYQSNLSITTKTLSELNTVTCDLSTQPQPTFCPNFIIHFYMYKLGLRLGRNLGYEKGRLPPKFFIFSTTSSRCDFIAALKFDVSL